MSKITIIRGSFFFPRSAKNYFTGVFWPNLYCKKCICTSLNPPWTLWKYSMDPQGSMNHLLKLTLFKLNLRKLTQNLPNENLILFESKAQYMDFKLYYFMWKVKRISMHSNIFVLIICFQCLSITAAIYICIYKPGYISKTISIWFTKIILY